MACAGQKCVLPIQCIIGFVSVHVLQAFLAAELQASVAFSLQASLSGYTVYCIVSKPCQASLASVIQPQWLIPCEQFQSTTAL